jgi:hypothetical protein
LLLFALLPFYFRLLAFVALSWPLSYPLMVGCFFFDPFQVYDILI